MFLYKRLNFIHKINKILKYCIQFNNKRKKKKKYILKMNRSDMQFEYICYISGALYYYYSQPVPRFHFTRPWYNKRTTY